MKENKAREEAFKEWHNNGNTVTVKDLEYFNAGYDAGHLQARKELAGSDGLIRTFSISDDVDFGGDYE